MLITFSNPRLNATFTDWPLGGNKRGTCTFTIEHAPKKGYRVLRQTTGKPKASTYGGRMAIVDGSNGRTYILQEAGIYDFIKVMRSDFMDATHDIGQNAAVFRKDPDFATLQQLIEQANPPQAA